MRAIRPLLLLVLVVAATAGAAYGTWPDLELALGVAFGGLLLMHIYTFARLGRLEKRRARVAATRASKARESRPRKSQKAGKKAKSQKSSRPWPHASEPATPIGASRPRSEEPEKVEEFLRVVLDEANSEEVSFLPPYASDEAADASLVSPYGSDEEMTSLVTPPLPEREGAADEREQGEHMGDLGEEIGPPEAYRNVPIPRHFALGTVAIIRKALTPAEVAQVLVEQRKRPREKFGEVAVKLGVLSDFELKELLLAQQQGLFTDEEIKEARGRIKAFRELEAAASPQ